MTLTKQVNQCRRHQRSGKLRDEKRRKRATDEEEYDEMGDEEHTDECKDLNRPQSESERLFSRPP